jgi:hypothetical protein
MDFSFFILSETGTNLKDVGAARSEEPFHAEFWRALEKLAVCLYGLNIEFGYEDRLADRGVDFQEMSIMEKRADGTEKGCTEVQPFKCIH